MQVNCQKFFQEECVKFSKLISNGIEYQELCLLTCSLLPYIMYQLCTKEHMEILSLIAWTLTSSNRTTKSYCKESNNKSITEINEVFLSTSGSDSCFITKSTGCAIIVYHIAPGERTNLDISVQTRFRPKVTNIDICHTIPKLIPILSLLKSAYRAL